MSTVLENTGLVDYECNILFSVYTAKYLQRPRAKRRNAILSLNPLYYSWSIKRMSKTCDYLREHAGAILDSASECRL